MEEAGNLFSRPLQHPLDFPLDIFKTIYNRL